MKKQKIKSDCDIDPFFNFMNNLQENLKFTKEIETYQQLPFLDFLVQRSADQYSTSQFFKKNRHWTLDITV